MFFKHWVPKKCYKMCSQWFSFFQKIFYRLQKSPLCWKIPSRILWDSPGLFFFKNQKVQKPNFFLKNFKNWKFFMVIKKWAFFIFLLSTFILKRFVFYFLFFRIIEIRNIGWFWWLVWIKFFNSCRRVEKCRKSLFFFRKLYFFD